jgi:hypothetical protein
MPIFLFTNTDTLFVLRFATRRFIHTAQRAATAWRTTKAILGDRSLGNGMPHHGDDGNAQKPRT